MENMTKLEAKLKCDVLKSKGQPPSQIRAKLSTAIAVLLTDTFNNYVVRDHNTELVEQQMMGLD